MPQEWRQSDAVAADATLEATRTSPVIPPIPRYGIFWASSVSPAKQRGNCSYSRYPNRSTMLLDNGDASMLVQACPSMIRVLTLNEGLVGKSWVIGWCIVSIGRPFNKPTLHNRFPHTCLFDPSYQQSHSCSISHSNK